MLSNFDEFFHDYPNFDSRRPFQTYYFKNKHFWLCSRCYTLTIWRDNNLHLVDFCSCNFFPTKINYEIHDKDFITIVDVFEEWCHLFKGVQHEIIVNSNHKKYNISWQFVFWINTKFDGHYPYIDFGLSSHIAFGISKENLMLSYCSYLVLKEKNATYKQ